MVDIPKTMKAVVKSENGYDNMSLKDIPVPEVKDDHVLLKVAYTGICGTDIHTFKGQYANTRCPIAVHLESQGVVNTDKMVTKTFDLEHWRDAFEAMMAGQELKVMIASNPDDPDLK